MYPEATERGMALAVHARTNPERLAIEDRHGSHTFGELNSRANQLVRVFRERGLEAGDGIALLCSNRVEFVETYAAVLRGGFRLTTINWHLTAEEAGYIVADCEAKAFVADVRFSDTGGGALKYAPDTTLQLSVGGSIPGFEDYESALRGMDTTDLVDPIIRCSIRRARRAGRKGSFGRERPGVH
jgi:long-chain acyl-CoA synthetase